MGIAKLKTPNADRIPELYSVDTPGKIGEQSLYLPMGMYSESDPNMSLIDIELIRI